MTTQVTIERLGHLGDGVARVNNADIFVPFALPGEEVEGQLEGQRLAKPRILKPVSERVKPPCRHFKTCGGCVTQHMSDALISEWQITSLRETLAQSGLHPEILETRTSPMRSRRRAVFAARRTKKSVVIGFHGRASDSLVEIQECAVIRPEILAAIDGLKRLARIGLTRKGEIRISVTSSLGGLDIELRDVKTLEPAQLVEVSAIAQQEGFARVVWNGETVLEIMPPLQQFGTAQVLPPPGAFLQATKEGETALTEAVLQICQGRKNLLDLFAGCGTFALPLAQNAEVRAIESDRDMLQALDGAWRKTAGLKTVVTEARDLFRRPLMADELKKIDAVVIDPPRAGAKAQVQMLADVAIPRIAFVSCNPATFARDAEILVAGGYTLDWLQIVDQFRWSAHKELVAQFSHA